MSSPDLQTVVIACPNCGTRYQVPYATIGTAGREVQCAQCSKPWHANADRAAGTRCREDDLIFSPRRRTALDAVVRGRSRGRDAAPQSPAATRADRPRPCKDPGRHQRGDRPHARPRPTSTPSTRRCSANRNPLTAFEQRLKPSSTCRWPRCAAARLAVLVRWCADCWRSASLRVDLVRTFPALAGTLCGHRPAGERGRPRFRGQQDHDQPARRQGGDVDHLTHPLGERSCGDRAAGAGEPARSDNNIAVYEWTVTPRAAEMESRRNRRISPPRSTRPPKAP